jgi:hypothetical protein
LNGTVRRPDIAPPISDNGSKRPREGLNKPFWKSVQTTQPTQISSCRKKAQKLVETGVIFTPNGPLWAPFAYLGRTYPAIAIK